MRKLSFSYSLCLLHLYSSYEQQNLYTEQQHAEVMCRVYKNLHMDKVAPWLIVSAGEMWPSDLVDPYSGLQQIKEHIHNLKDFSLLVYQRRSTTSV